MIDTPLVGTVAEVARSRRELIVENALLRQQLLVLQRQANESPYGHVTVTVLVEAAIG